jgi:hypothetical protein
MLGLVLQTGAYNLAEFLTRLDELGFFAYVLPFLLIFGVAYALLTQIKIFGENKGASVLVSVAIGILALQLDFVPVFFQDVFPKFGIGIAFLIIALILAGAFIAEGDDKMKNAFKWIFFGVGMLIAAIITLSSLSGWSFMGSLWWERYGTPIIMVTLAIAAVVLVIAFSKQSTGSGSSGSAGRG